VTRYKHTQIGYTIIWLPAAAAVLVAIGGSFESWPHREILLVVSIMLLIAIPAFYKLAITIDDKTLAWSFGVGIIRKKVPIAQIAHCEPIRIRWWYGWGIHLTPYGWLYNVAGWETVVVRLRNGRKLALGTNDPRGLTNAIRDSLVRT
jgi:hypothetical protein